MIFRFSDCHMLKMLVLFTSSNNKQIFPESIDLEQFR